MSAEPDPLPTDAVLRGFASALDLLRDEHHTGRVSTGCAVLDSCLGGGVAVGSVTEARAHGGWDRPTLRRPSALTFLGARCSLLVRARRARPSCAFSWRCKYVHTG